MSMRITAPDAWLDDVDIAALRKRFLERGWTEGRGGWLSGPDCSQVILPLNLREYNDWKHRLLEAIETAALLEGITAVEWFVAQKRGAWVADVAIGLKGLENMNERYDIRGNAYRVKTTLDDGTVLGCPLYDEPETGEEMEDELQVIAVPLFDHSPRQKVDSELAELSAKVAAARKELSRLTQDVREAEKDGKARLAKLAQYDQLKRLEDFLDDKITHYVVADYGPPKIMSLAETKAEYSERDLRLLCLFGTTTRSLVWKLNRYNDGSGCWSYVFPCCSFDEAKETADKIFADRFAGKSVEGVTSQPARNWLDAADKIGIPVPAEYRAAVEDSEAVSRAKEITSLEAKLAALRAAT